MIQQTVIDELRNRHHLLDGEIEAENTLACPDGTKVSTLKKQKLKIKDLINELEPTN